MWCVLLLLFSLVLWRALTSNNVKLECVSFDLNRNDYCTHNKQHTGLDHTHTHLTHTHALLTHRHTHSHVTHKLERKQSNRERESLPVLFAVSSSPTTSSDDVFGVGCRLSASTNEKKAEEQLRDCCTCTIFSFQMIFSQ